MTMLTRLKKEESKAGAMRRRKEKAEPLRQVGVRAQIERIKEQG